MYKQLLTSDIDTTSMDSNTELYHSILRQDKERVEALVMRLWEENKPGLYTITELAVSEYNTDDIKCGPPFLFRLLNIDNDKITPKEIDFACSLLTLLKMMWKPNREREIQMINSLDCCDYEKFRLTKHYNSIYPVPRKPKNKWQKW